MKGLKKVMSVVALIASLFSLSQPVLATAGAESTSESAAEGGFYYRSVIPENQRDTGSTFFDLRMTPGQQQTVHIDFTNTSDEEITVSTGLFGAKTNQNGVIEYGPTGLENDASLKYAFEDVVTGPDELVLAPNGTTPLELNINMPEEALDGYIAGGIWFQEKDEGGEEQTGVVHKTAYIVGMLLSETDNPVTPNLELNEVYAKLNNYRGAIYVNFSNVTPAFLNRMTVNTSIATADAPDEEVYSSRTTGMSMAPNSYLDYPVSLGGDRYTPGDYIATIDVFAGDQEWRWTQEFTITADVANELNEQDVSLVQERGFNWWIILAIAGGVLVLILIIYLILHNRNQKNRKPKRR